MSDLLWLLARIAITLWGLTHPAAAGSGARVTIPRPREARA